MVSNRGPVSFVERNGDYEMTRGAGGMAGALDPVARSLADEAVWIATATSEDDRKAIAAGAADRLSTELGYPLRLLEIDPETYSRYYDGVSNRMLWFASHCLWDELEIKDFGREELDAWRNAYGPVNRRFAQAIADVSRPSSLVLVQDYHLTLTPGFLREQRPDQTILHFTHSSFCGPEGLERIPAPIPRQVIEGMLGADLVGFHVAPWVHGFLDCCERIGLEVDRKEGKVVHRGRASWVREYPIPIEAEELKERAQDASARRWAERFASFNGALVARADRAEPSKNIVRGFEAFGALLDRRPSLRNDVRFVACVYPSRQSMPEYRRYTERITDAVQRVNERHPGSIELYLEDDYDRTLGALAVYDVLLVNPLMDGMNLVSKEGPTVNERSGVLVLSRGAGSYEELGEHAITIDDARDVDATADALERALQLPRAERERRWRQLSAVATARRPADWIDAQLEDLEAIQSGQPPHTAPC